MLSVVMNSLLSFSYDAYIYSLCVQCIHDIVFAAKVFLNLYIILLFGFDIIVYFLYCCGLCCLDKTISITSRFSHRFREIASISITSLPPLLCTLINLFCVLYLKYTWWWYIPYVAYAFLDPTPLVGGRPSKCFRRLPIWKHSANYFPANLHFLSSVKFTSEKPYIFCYHPHGIFSAGAILAFGSEALEISSKLPHLKIFPCTLTSLFCVPFFREWILLQGFISVSSKSIQYLLSKGPGYGIMVVVGGASEAQHTLHDQYNLILLRRKGIFKQALLYGCYLVPIFCFGENNIYHIHRSNSWLVWISSLCKRILGFCIPAFSGRGFFQKQFGCLPLRYPLNIVVGEPLSIPKTDNPTSQDIEKVQKQYCDVLHHLFESVKSTHSSSKSTPQLRFIS